MAQMPVLIAAPVGVVVPPDEDREGMSLILMVLGTFGWHTGHARILQHQVGRSHAESRGPAPPKQ